MTKYTKEPRCVPKRHTPGFLVGIGARIAHLIVILRRQPKNLLSYRLCFVLFEILHCVQNDKLGFVGVNCISCVGVGVSAPRCRGGSPCPPVEFY